METEASFSRRVLSELGVEITEEDRWRGVRCPFHGDRHSSASTHGGRGIFVCHTCSVKGDAVHVLMSAEGLTHEAAIERAEQLAGATAPSEKPKRRQRNQRTKYVPPGR